MSEPFNFERSFLNRLLSPPSGAFCDVCGVEMTSMNTSMMLTDKCGNCNEIERGQ